MINVAVSITKDEAEVVNRLQKYYESRYNERAKEQLIKDFCKDKQGWSDADINKFVGRLSLEEFIQVFIYSNYELTKTNEEKLADYYDSQGNGVSGIASKLCIEQVLDILKIKIKGINEQ
ncbi:hypothetical protein CN984_12100 [Bacillus cereus]|uniref:Uncharacterized protein n=1 Tax=Bacillus cereus TaxID=1396 RepID=A0A2B9Q421_BACCE|nr:hypothetical protein [Bacillus cereus]PGO29181.1 hypothetical protein CN984_12100 [Bacillus cereus]